MRIDLGALVVAAGWLTLEGCEGLASSPPEAAQPARNPASDSPCLAQTHPLLAHTGVLGSQQLVALDSSGAAVQLDRGSFVYGSTWSPDGRTIAFRRRSTSALVPGERGRGTALTATELDLFSPDVAGEEVVLLVDEAPALDSVTRRYPDGPICSPDGRQLVFATLRGYDH